jgi:hypothetical protein
VDKTDGRLTATFDIDEICENVELRNAFAEMVDIQRDGIGVAVFILSLVEDLIGRLGGDRSKPVSMPSN